MKRLYILSLLTFITSFCLAQGTETILTRLGGNWSAKGTAFGMPATITMRWTPVLGGKFHQLDYRMIMTAQDGARTMFDGIALYRSMDKNSFTATWFDSQGEMHPITATADDTTLTSLWGSAETKQGKTTYRFVSDQEVEITDYIMKKDGGWSKFNQNTVTRD